MTGSFEEIADAFGELADTLEKATTKTGLPDDEIVTEGPEVPELNIDVPGDPEYHFGSMQELARVYDTTVKNLEATVPDEVLEDATFWAFIAERAGVDGLLLPLQRPFDDGDDSGPSVKQVIIETIVADVASVEPNEGQVERPTSAEEVDKATEQRFIEALTNVRSMDQKLDNLEEARSNLTSALGVAGKQLERLVEDREKLQDALERGQGDIGLMRELLDEVEKKIEDTRQTAAIAEEKIDRIDSRASDIVADRNEYRGYVDALITEARTNEDSPLHGNVEEVYRGYRIRSGDDVPFRAQVVKHVLVMIQVRNNRGDDWVSQQYLVDRGQDVYGYSREEIAKAVNLLLTTGELIRRENEYRIDPLIG